MEIKISHGRLVVCVVVFGFAYLATPAVFDLDDAYIPLYGAQVAVGGSDPVYGAPALAGATSPAYVALLIGALTLGIRGVLALRIATAAGLGAYVFALWRLGAALKLSVPQKLVLLVLTLGSGLVLMQATNGLETGWAMALLTYLIAEALQQNIFATVFGAALLPFFRPDLIPAAAAVVLYAWRGRAWREKTTAATLAMFIGAPLLLWLRYDTGAWAPQTIQAKAFFFAQACQPLRLKAVAVYATLSACLLTMWPLTICAVTLWRERLGRYGLAAIGLTLTAFLIRFPDGLAHNYSRYLYAILTPWLSYGAGLRLSRGGPLARVPLIASLTVAALVMWPFIQPAHGQTALELQSAAEWVERNTPEDAVILVHDAGAISVFAHHRAVDLVGLKTMSSIAAHQRWTMPSCGRDRAKAVAEIALASHASYMVAVSDWDDIFQLRSGLEANGFALTPLRRPASNTRGYTIYRLAHSAR